MVMPTGTQEVGPTGRTIRFHSPLFILSDRRETVIICIHKVMAWGLLPFVLMFSFLFSIELFRDSGYEG